MVEGGVSRLKQPTQVSLRGEGRGGWERGKEGVGGEKGLREEWRILFVYYNHMFYVL